MLAQLTIPKQKNAPVALDHQALFAIGLQHVERLASRIWNDYNVHDPGITTLELLCYALTDLSYRAAFPIQDLLATSSGNLEQMNDQFFTARRILPNRALTTSDYRKLIIDLKGVKNAWIMPATEIIFADRNRGRLHRDNPGGPGVVPVEVEGFYRVAIEYMDEVRQNSDKEAIKLKVGEVLHASRNLCEDFVAIAGIEKQEFVLCAELELAPDADVERVHAEALFQTQQYLSPPVNQYTLAQMLVKTHRDGTPYTAEEIFDGPSLSHGFISDEELAASELRTEIRLSDIISIIMDIEGVRAVRDIVINPAGATDPLPNKWLIPVDAGKQAQLNRETWRLVSYKRSMPFTGNSAITRALWDEMAEQARLLVETEVVDDFEIPLGTFRQPEQYYSFQNHYPALYGLSDAGVSDSQGSRRRALARQLKGYLLFFDQIMADYFAQLSHVRDLFSTDPLLDSTYFHQVVKTFAEYEKIYALEEAEMVAALREIAENRDAFVRRRNRFLDHLIARFAERFHEFASIMRSEFGTGDAEMIRYKCEFLQNYPRISSQRGLAYNYTLKGEADIWDSRNISGLEQRLAALLGIRDSRRRNLGGVSYDRLAEIETTAEDDFRFRVRNRDTDEIILSSSVKYPGPGPARRAMRRAIDFALVRGSYQRKVAVNGQHFFNIVDDAEEVVARHNRFFDTEEEMEVAIDAIIDYLRSNLYPDVEAAPAGDFRFRIRNLETGENIFTSSAKFAAPLLARDEMLRTIRVASRHAGYQLKGEGEQRFFAVVDSAGKTLTQRSKNFRSLEEMNAAIDAIIGYLRDTYSDEGMYLVENILLLPDRGVSDELLLPICPDPNCTDCSDEDPYSYRIQIILPAYGSRFEDMEFRRWCEQVIREETPAHILPKICWINRDDMVLLEILYHDWVALKAETDTTAAERKLADLITALFTVKNVYPVQSLNECDDLEADEKFILGRSALGTMK